MCLHPRSLVHLACVTAQQPHAIEDLCEGMRYGSKVRPWVLSGDIPARSLDHCKSAVVFNFNQVSRQVEFRHVGWQCVFCATRNDGSQLCGTSLAQFWLFRSDVGSEGVGARGGTWRLSASVRLAKSSGVMVPLPSWAMLVATWTWATTDAFWASCGNTSFVVILGFDRGYLTAKTF